MKTTTKSTKHVWNEEFKFNVLGDGGNSKLDVHLHSPQGLCAKGSLDLADVGDTESAISVPLGNAQGQNMGRNGTLNVKLDLQVGEGVCRCPGELESWSRGIPLPPLATRNLLLGVGGGGLGSPRMVVGGGGLEKMGSQVQEPSVLVSLAGVT